MLLFIIYILTNDIYCIIFLSIIYITHLLYIIIIFVKTIMDDNYIIDYVQSFFL